MRSAVMTTALLHPLKYVVIYTMCLPMWQERQQSFTCAVQSGGKAVRSNHGYQGNRFKQKPQVLLLLCLSQLSANHRPTMYLPNHSL